MKLFFVSLFLFFIIYFLWTIQKSIIRKSMLTPKLLNAKTKNAIHSCYQYIEYDNDGVFYKQLGLGRTTTGELELFYIKNSIVFPFDMNDYLFIESYRIKNNIEYLKVRVFVLDFSNRKTEMTILDKKYIVERLIENEYSNENKHRIKHKYKKEMGLLK